MKQIKDNYKFNEIIEIELVKKKKENKNEEKPKKKGMKDIFYIKK
jgi:hypothetical protein